MKDAIVRGSSRISGDKPLRPFPLLFEHDVNTTYNLTDNFKVEAYKVLSSILMGV